MADVKNYSENEAWERIYNVLIGVDPNDQEGYLGQMAQNEAISRIAQLMEGSLGLSFDPLSNLRDEFGGIYTWTGTTVMESLIDDWTKITGAFQNSMLTSANVTAQPTQDRVLLADGTYEVDWQIAFQGSSAMVYSVEPYIGSLGVPQAKSDFTPSASGSVAQFSGHGVINTSGTSAYLTLRVKPATTASWFKLVSAQLRARRIKDT